MGLFGLGKKKAPEALTQSEAEALEDRGVEAYHAGNYKKALPLFLQAAEYGFSSSQFNCGLMFEHGRGTAQDEKQALRWYMKAAQQGNEMAQYRAAVLIEQGKGAPEPSMEHALTLYQMAAENGVLAAQLRCAEWYAQQSEDEDDFFDEPSSENEKEALKWYEMAAEQGDMQAQKACGIRYEHGRGTEKDPVRALMWYEKAAEQGDSYAQGVCADWYYRGVGTEKNMEKAVMWRDRAMAKR